MANNTEVQHRAGRAVKIETNLPVRERSARNSARVSTRKHGERDALLLMATQRFCGLSDHDRLSIDQFREAFHALAGSVADDTKGQIAALVSREPATPRDVLLYLALEPVSISAPVLNHALTLSQLDLLRIATKGGLNHALEIAARPDLGPSLVRHLRGLNDGAINKALKNNGAILDDLSKRSLDAIYDSITTKPLKPFNDAAWEKKTTASEAEPAVSSGAANETLLRAAGRGGRLKNMQARKARDSAPKTLLTPDEFAQALERAALKRSRPALSALMSKQFDLADDTTDQILDDKSGDTLAVLMKSAGIDAARANRVAMLTFPSIGLSVANARRAIRFYRELTQESCIAAVAQWPKRRLPSVDKTKHAPLSSDATGGRHRHSTSQQTNDQMTTSNGRVVNG